MRSNSLLLLLSALGLLAAGCPGGLDDPFPRGVPGSGPVDDDDVGHGDDDDDTSVNEPPQITILGLQPSTLPVAGTVEVVLQISDPDSSGYSVELEFGTEGVAGNWAAASVANATTPPNVFEEDLGGTSFAVQTELQWESAIDIPVTAEDGALKACARDPEGNTACDTWPDEEGGMPVDNYTFNGGGAFCQPGDLEGLNWVAGRAFVPLSDGNCLNYQASEPPLPDDFSAQFLMVLTNPNESEVNFRISAVSQPNFPEQPIPLSPQQAVNSYQARAWPNGKPARTPAADLFSAAGKASVSQHTMDGGAPQSRVSAVSRDLADQLAAQFGSRFDDQPPGFEPPAATCAPDLDASDVNFDARNFYLRSSIESDERITRAANLRALGDSIAIYVDEETPMDIDLDCSDPNNPIQPNPLPAFGFTNCDLQQVVDIVDQNIMPTLEALYGEPSDVDQNCRVTVFLSHRLNRYTATSSDDTDDSYVVRSFSEPEIDLWERNLQENPFSNEQEILYVYAPDPVGFWSDNPVGLDAYLDYDLSGRIAVALQNLISYSQHRDVAKELMDPLDPVDLSAPDAEEDWLNDAMGLLAADMSGFGSIAFLDAWIYMDRSHLLPLLEENELSDFQDRGGQYLFARYLYDLFGSGVIQQIIESDTTGIETVLELLPPDTEFADFALQWATAMAVSGRLNEAGGLLVPDSVIPNYKSSTTVTVADPQNPVPGELFGANGFQQGFNVRGINRTYRGGDEPTGAEELLSARVRAENLDPLVFHPQADFFGTVAGNYGATVVLVSGLEQPVNYLIVESDGGSELLGNVIRIGDTDPLQMAVTLEDVDGAKITTVRELGNLAANELDPTGAERRVIGRIDDSETFEVLTPLAAPELGDDDDSAVGDDDDSAGVIVARADDDDDSAAEEEEVDIDDVDRYSFSLTSTTTVGIWVDRRISSLSGDVSLDDPFLAVALASDVPDAFDYLQWDFGPNFGVCPDPQVYVPGESVFYYPIVMMDWIAAQANLSSNPVVEGDYDVAVGTGPVSGLTCEYDHDQDGIPDEDEPTPESLYAQILQRQAENLNDDPTFYQGTFDLLPGALARDTSVPFYDASFLDADSNETPDDERATAFLAANVGGRAAEGGEEAAWLGTLPPGDYIVLVGGADGATGPYDLSLRVVPPAWLQ